MPPRWAPPAPHSLPPVKRSLMLAAGITCEKPSRSSRRRSSRDQISTWPKERSLAQHGCNPDEAFARLVYESQRRNVNCTSSPTNCPHHFKPVQRTRYLHSPQSAPPGGRPARRIGGFAPKSHNAKRPDSRFGTAQLGNSEHSGRRPVRDGSGVSRKAVSGVHPLLLRR
jgi:hypothetical protein